MLWPAARRSFLAVGSTSASPSTTTQVSSRPGWYCRVSRPCAVDHDLLHLVARLAIGLVLEDGELAPGAHLARVDRGFPATRPATSASTTPRTASLFSRSTTSSASAVSITARPLTPATATSRFSERIRLSLRLDRDRVALARIAVRVLVHQLPDRVPGADVGPLRVGRAPRRHGWTAPSPPCRSAASGSRRRRRPVDRAGPDPAVRRGSRPGCRAPSAPAPPASAVPGTRTCRCSRDGCRWRAGLSATSRLRLLDEALARGMRRRSPGSASAGAIQPKPVSGRDGVMPKVTSQPSAAAAQAGARAA